MEDITEIQVTYLDGSEVVYRGNGIKRFFREFSPKEKKTEPQTQAGYYVSGVTYAPNKDMSPMELARKMKADATKSGINFD
jgi:hypothetical protein